MHDYWLLQYVHDFPTAANQNPLSDASQAESRHHMCGCYTSDQHRPSDESSYGLRSTEASFVEESWKWLPTWIPQKQLNRVVLVMTRLPLRYFEIILSPCSQSLPQTSFSAATLVTGLSECAEFGLEPPLRFSFFFAESNASTPCNSEQMKSPCKVWLDTRLTCWTSRPRCY